jgi:hypothetical protein
LVAACAPTGTPPVIDPISDQTASVGTELAISLRASDADHDPIQWSFRSDVPDLGDRAVVSSYGDGSRAVFRWTPLAEDVGTWSFDLIASDGTHAVAQTITIDVQPTDAGAAPVFRSPLGSGTTLDPSVMPCLDVPIVVEDADSAQVTITQEAPVIAGAMLTSTGALTATWHFCPTADQIAASDRYLLVLSASDGTHQTDLDYLIVIDRPPPPPPPACVDDSWEPDDSTSTARHVDYAVPYTSTGDQICAGNDDWYRVYFFSGETIHATLTFDQQAANQDLDLHVYDDSSTDLTPCTEADPSTCRLSWGQGSASNEDLSFAVSSSGWYYVVVHGWDGSQNAYAICIGLSDTDCPHP